jgi:hypothetical protein
VLVDAGKLEQHAHKSDPEAAAPLVFRDDGEGTLGIGDVATQLLQRARAFHTVR